MAFYYQCKETQQICKAVRKVDWKLTPVHPALEAPFFVDDFQLAQEYRRVKWKALSTEAQRRASL